ncbi:MAG: hypothetical protein R3E79_53560 [Caldilineaceae bacterium]
MRAFAELYAALDETNKTNAKLALLKEYFSSAPAVDAAWCSTFSLAADPGAPSAAGGWPVGRCGSGAADWLFGESYDAVGDIAETITLLLPETEIESDLPLHVWVEERLFPLQDLPEPEQASSGGASLAS